MTNSNILGGIILLFVIGGSFGWLLQEVPEVTKKKFMKKKSQHIKVGMYYKTELSTNITRSRPL